MFWKLNRQRKWQTPQLSAQAHSGRLEDMLTATHCEKPRSGRGNVTKILKYLNLMLIDYFSNPIPRSEIRGCVSP